MAKEIGDMTDLELLEEWRGLLRRQRALSDKRGKERGVSLFGGFIGILVAKDELALQYQELDGQTWDIKRTLFGDLWFWM